MERDQGNIFHGIVACVAVTFILVVFVGLVLCAGELAGWWDVPGIVTWRE